MNKNMATNTYLSTITLKANGLNAPISRHMVTEWITKQDLYICCPQETSFRSKDTHRLQVKGWKNIFHKNQNKTKQKAG